MASKCLRISVLPKGSISSPVTQTVQQTKPKSPPPSPPLPAFTLEDIQDALGKTARQIKEEMAELFEDKSREMREDIVLALQELAAHIERLDERVDDVVENAERLEDRVVPYASGTHFSCTLLHERILTLAERMESNSGPQGLIHYITCTMQSLQSILDGISQGDSLVSIDSTEVYLHFPIPPAHRQFLRFSYRNRHIQYKARWYGLSLAPRIFIKIPTVLAAHIRKIRDRQIRVFMVKVAPKVHMNRQAATDVSFSFNVGNGPVEIIIKSPHPLTDDQWHQVIAERNVKEASLQVDQFPREIQKAPTEGHTRLELYSQLYVDVGAFFEEGMWLQYNFSSVGNNMKDSGSKTPLSSKESENFVSDLSLNKEEISFSFSTSKAPCILLYISAYSQDYMAVLVTPAGSLQVRYKLGGAKEPYNINIDHRNMSNGQPHSVNITRAGKDIILQLDLYPPVSYTIPGPSSLQFSSLKSLFLGKVIELGKIDQDIDKYNTPGFSGCLSRVKFNQITPLKAALRQTNISSDIYTEGELVESNCGANPQTIQPMSSTTDPWHPDSGAELPYNGQVIGSGVNRNSAIIGGIIAVVIFTILCTLVFLIRYMFRHKGTYHTNEAKGAESAESADAAIMNNDPNFTETIDESKKEWLI
ncbi:contactin-associated protein-like 2 [Crotalus tigris]|nr:contactin-associated protein-like 2 [Crotalus tigris]